MLKILVVREICKCTKTMIPCGSFKAPAQYFSCPVFCIIHLRNEIFAVLLNLTDSNISMFAACLVAPAKWCIVR